MTIDRNRIALTHSILLVSIATSACNAPAPPPAPQAASPPPIAETPYEAAPAAETPTQAPLAAGKTSESDIAPAKPSSPRPSAAETAAPVPSAERPQSSSPKPIATPIAQPPAPVAPMIAKTPESALPKPQRPATEQVARDAPPSVTITLLSRGKGAPSQSRDAYKQIRALLEQRQKTSAVTAIQVNRIGLEGETRLCAEFRSRKDAQAALAEIRKLASGVELLNVDEAPCSTRKDYTP